MSIDYCAEQVRAHDYERYVTTLFAPRSVRPALWALYAFHHEIARVEQQVNEKLMGLIRLQWWHDALVQLYAGNVLAHPVLAALHQAIQNGAPWRLEQFHDMIDAYRQQIEEDIPSQAGRILLQMACDTEGQSVDENMIDRVAHGFDAYRKDNLSQEQITQLVGELQSLPRSRVSALLVGDIALQYMKKSQASRTRGRPVNKNRYLFMLPFYLWRRRFIFF